MPGGEEGGALGGGSSSVALTVLARPPERQDLETLDTFAGLGGRHPLQYMAFDVTIVAG